MQQDAIYNTLMAVPVGLGLLLLVAMGYQLARGRPVYRPAWAGVFIALGSVLILLGGHMTLTWPLTGPTAFDNIVFGEPSLAMGVILVVGAVLLGSDRFWPEASSGGPAARAAGGELRPARAELTSDQWSHLARLLQPLSWFGFAMGLALISIAFIGPFFSPWEAPPQEPISGEFADQPWIENAFISALYAITAIGAILTPFALMRPTFSRALALLKPIGACWLLTGTALLVFGAMNYYTHSGLVINVFEESQQQEQQQEQEETQGEGQGP